MTSTERKTELLTKAVAEDRGVIVFGPIPSRRLGRSLGVNNIPPKHCSYSCIYCQVGPTLHKEHARRVFYEPGEVVQAVTRKVEACRGAGQGIDYLTFVPDGEPTLDLHLGTEIRGVKALGIPVAVITNASLLWMPEVRAELAAADLVSVKVDAVDPEIWRRANRPHGELDLETVLGGVLDFAREYPGELLSETMLVHGVNDGASSVEKVAAFLEKVAPRRAVLAIPTRPPAESEVRPAGAEAVVRAHVIFAAKLPRVELLVTREEETFGHSGEPTEDLLAILAVHPMRQQAVEKYLREAGADPGRGEELVRSGRILRLEYQGEVFFVRRFGSETPEPALAGP